jgi:hypothetical protein
MVTGAALLAGCGGGGNSGGGGTTGATPPPAVPSFTLSLSSSTLEVSGGTSGSVTVSVSGSNGFNSGVNITLSGLPSGVTVSPSSVDLSAGGSQQFTFTAASYVAPSTSSVYVTGFSGSGSDKLPLSLQVALYVGNTALTRTSYVRTDAVQPYTVLFDSATDRFFMSDPGSNQIFVLDGTTRQLIGSIPVPGAYGLDETPDHTILYAGTQIGDVYAIDPVHMQVTHRYIASQIGPEGYQAYAVRVMANGELALLGGQGGIPSVDGYDSFAIWNPTNNSIQVYGGNLLNQANCTDENHIFGFTVTGDRSLVVILNGNNVCTLNPVSGQVNSVNVGGLPVTPTPDGKSLLVLQEGVQAQIIALNAQTLVQTTSFPVVGPSGSFMIVSPDSSTVYIAPDFGGIVYAYNIATGSQVGWLPDLNLGPEVSTWISAVDNTGLLAGVTFEGIGFLDAAAMRTGPVGTAFFNGYLTPATGPVAGGTSVDMSFPASGNLAAVYFGPNLSASISPTSSVLHATTPPGSAGPVDVVSMMTDGGMQILPQAFSYGPSILEATPNASTADGVGTGVIYGYGFSPISLPSNQIPSDVQVTIGGQLVKITAFSTNPYNDGSAPTPLQSISFTIPPGTAGTAADITVTTQSGTATLSGGMHYLPAEQQAPLSGRASLVQGIYDPTRDVYDFTDASEIRVYSRTQNQWLTSIQVPAAPTGTTHRLWGIALSPDGSKLAVSDASAGMIYLINPDSPGSVQSFVFNEPYFAGQPSPLGAGVVTNPAGLAVSDTGMIYLAAFTVGGDGLDGFFKLDTTSGQVTDYGVSDFGGPLYKVAITSDNSRVFFNNDGAVFSIETATDAISSASDDPSCCYGDYDLTLSGGQTTLEATSYLYDTTLDAESYLTLNDREVLNISYVYGAQLSVDGTLLFQPSTNGIDVYDGRLGTLRTRIALPIALSQNYDALVGDGVDNILIAIIGQSGSGIAIVDLSSLSEPAPLPYRSHRLAGEAAPSVGHEFTFPGTPHGTTTGPRVIDKFTIPHITNQILLSKPVP